MTVGKKNTHSDFLKKTFGATSINDFLQTLDESSDVTEKGLLRSYLLTIVGALYSIPFADIVKGTKRDCTEAKKVVMFVMNRHEGYSIRQIANHFDTSKGTVHYHLSSVDYWLKIDAYETKGKIKVINERLNDFKKHLKNN